MSLCVDETAGNYSIWSFPRASRGGGIAVTFKTSLVSHLAFGTDLPFVHSSFEF